MYETVHVRYRHFRHSKQGSCIRREETKIHSFNVALVCIVLKKLFPNLTPERIAQCGYDLVAAPQRPSNVIATKLLERYMGVCIPQCGASNQSEAEGIVIYALLKNVITVLRAE
jgi:hypothetical protein